MRLPPSRRDRGDPGRNWVGLEGIVEPWGEGAGRLTERAKECGGGYIHHPPTRSPYPLIRSVRSLCRSARHDTCTGSRACIAPCSRLALLRENQSILELRALLLALLAFGFGSIQRSPCFARTKVSWSFVRYYSPSSPLASVRPAMCAPLLRLRCPPVSGRLCFAVMFTSKGISLTL